MDKKEYEKMMGLASVDIGSRKMLIKQCKKFVNKKSGLHKLKKKQLLAIYRKNI